MVLKFYDLVRVSAFIKTKQNKTNILVLTIVKEDLKYFPNPA